MTVRLGPSKATRLPLADGCKPSPASMMPALTSSSLYLPIASSNSVEGIRPASLSAVAFTITITRIGCSPLIHRGHTASLLRRRTSFGKIDIPPKRFALLLYGPRVDDACDLLDVRPFVPGQPPCVEQHGPLERLAGPRHGRRAQPVCGRQRFQDRQEFGALRGKGTQRGPELQLAIVRLPD